MRKLIVTALMAAVALPALAPSAMAQSNGELRRDRQDIRQEQRDVRQAQRSGSARDVREERRELRDARQEYREDLRDARGDRRYDRDRNWRDNDWQNWRRSSRNEFRRGNWNAPFRYSQFRAGSRITPNYYGQRFIISDPWRYHLPRITASQRWVRHYDDLLLIDVRRGVVVRVLNNFYW